MIFDELIKEKKSHESRKVFSIDDINKITSIVNHESSRINDNTKSTIVLIGLTEIGKSTTINALLGVPLERNKKGRIVVRKSKESENEEDDNSRSVMNEESEKMKDIEEFEEYEKKMLNEKEEINEIAEIGKSNQPQTKYPKRYSNNNLNFDVLDTRGLAEEGMEGNEVTASALILDRYMCTTNSVTVLILNTYSNYCEEDSFYSLRNIVNGLCSSLNIPLIFVANRYKPHKKVEKDKIANLKDDEYNKHMDDILKEDLMERCNEEEKKSLEELLKSDNGKELVEKMDKYFSDKEMSSDLEIEIKMIINKIEEDKNVVNKGDILNHYNNYLYIKIIKRELENNRVIYFDPLRKCSVERLRFILSNNPPSIDPRIVTLSNSLEESKIFMKYLNDEIRILIYVVEVLAIYFSLPVRLEDTYKYYKDKMTELKMKIEEVKKKKEKNPSLNDPKEIERYKLELEQCNSDLDKNIYLLDDLDYELKETKSRKLMMYSKKEFLNPFPMCPTIVEEDLEYENTKFSINACCFSLEKKEDMIKNKKFKATFVNPLDMNLHENEELYPIGISQDHLDMYKNIKSAEEVFLVMTALRGMKYEYLNVLINRYCSISFYIPRCDSKNMVVKRRKIELDIDACEQHIEEIKKKIKIYNDLIKNATAEERMTKLLEEVEMNYDSLKSAMELKEKCKELYDNNRILINRISLFIYTLNLESSDLESLGNSELLQNEIPSFFETVDNNNNNNSVKKYSTVFLPKEITKAICSTLLNNKVYTTTTAAAAAGATTTTTTTTTTNNNNNNNNNNSLITLRMLRKEVENNYSKINKSVISNTSPPSSSSYLSSTSSLSSFISCDSTYPSSSFPSLTTTTSSLSSSSSSSSFSSGTYSASDKKENNVYEIHNSSCEIYREFMEDIRTMIKAKKIYDYNESIIDKEIRTLSDKEKAEKVMKEMEKINVMIKFGTKLIKEYESLNSEKNN